MQRVADFMTHSKLTIEFDEEKKVITIHTPAKNTITMSDEGKSITVADPITVARYGNMHLKR